MKARRTSLSRRAALTLGTVALAMRASMGVAAAQGVSTSSMCFAASEELLWTPLVPSSEPAWNALSSSSSEGVSSAANAWTTPIATRATDASTERDAAESDVAWSASDGDELTTTLAALDVLAARYPALRDRFELRRVEVLLEAPGTSLEGACGLETALASPLASVAAHARVARVRCLLRTDDPTSEHALDELEARYPELPAIPALELERASSQARLGRSTHAVATFRAVALRWPWTDAGLRAYEQLATLAASGVEVQEWTVDERIDRAERLVRSGPPEVARRAVAELREASLAPSSAAAVLRLAARLARVEGRFADADALLREAALLVPVRERPPEPVARPSNEVAVEQLATWGVEVGADEETSACGLRRLSSSRLGDALRTAARADVRPVLDALVRESTRRALPCPTRIDLAVYALGNASDELVARSLDACSGDVRATYLRARAAERAGDVTSAVRDFRRVIADDATDTHFYRMWASTRLRVLGALSDEDVSADVPTTRRNASEREVLDADAVLADVASRHGAAFPWVERARESLAMGDAAAAREELHDLYLAWNDARGRGPLRAGIEAVFRGAARPRAQVPSSIRRARRALSGADAVAIGRVAESLGDVGLAMRFGASLPNGSRPRAYEQLVEAAAARHGLDPNLLFAVMRVESVYDAEIVSYAGAIGLLQIMPRTGRLIAHALGRDDFETDELLDPATNIEFAAWYLASLLDRFDGRLPLAIAAYNGGPHNVARWIEEHGPQTSLDAFLEHIPFDQTFRYVRRVLSHYVAYRAQAGLELPELDVTLPPPATDTVAF